MLLEYLRESAALESYVRAVSVSGADGGRRMMTIVALYTLSAIEMKRIGEMREERNEEKKRGEESQLAT